MDFGGGEALLSEPVTLAEQHSDSAGPEVGLAFVDLVTHYGAAHEVDIASDTARQAVSIYGRCISAGKQTVLCNQRLAHVEGMIGAILFNAGRFRESKPWLASVVA